MDKEKKKTDQTDDDVTIESDVSLEGGGKDPAEKIKKLKDDLKKALAERAEYLDGWQRTKADFINFKKQTEQEKGNFIKYAKEEIIQDFLPVLDSFERAKSDTKAWESLPEEWKKGFQGIFSLLKASLENHGVKEIKPEGEIFDHEIHDAISTQEVSQKDQDGKIISVAETGYSLNEKIIRPPKVVVGEYKKSHK